MTQILSIVGSPRTVGSASGQRIYAFNTIGPVPTQVAGISPERQKITFHNPGSVDVYVGPAFVQNTGSDVALVPSPTALGGCFIVFANGGTVILEGEVGKAWQAFTLGATNAALTVMVSTT